MELNARERVEKNGIYILGPYMKDTTTLSREYNLITGNESYPSTTDQIEVTAEIFGEWLMNAKTVNVVVISVDEDEGETYTNNFVLSRASLIGPSTVYTDFYAEQIKIGPYGESNVAAAENLWPLFSKEIWQYDYDEPEKLTAVHMHGRFIFNVHLSDDQADFKFVSVTKNQMVLQWSGESYSDTITYSITSTFF